MPKTKIVSVTAEHIAHGIRRDCGHCPVALALNSAGFQNALHGSALWAQNLPPQRAPQRVRQFMHDFDLDKAVRPFKFRVRLK